MSQSVHSAFGTSASIQFTFVSLQHIETKQNCLHFFFQKIQKLATSLFVICQSENEKELETREIKKYFGNPFTKRKKCRVEINQIIVLGNQYRKVSFI